MHDPFTEPSDTRQAILGAAYRALCEHGYADITISRIGEEFDKSPSLVYHHYNGKDELLLDLLEFLLDGFEESISEGEFDLSPRERIDTYVTATTDPNTLTDEHVPDGQFLTAMVELRAQAANDDAYRDHFDRSDRVFHAFLEQSLREAAVEYSRSTPEPTTAEPIDPAEAAAVLQTVATGGMVRWVTTTDRAWVDHSRAGVQRYVEMILPRIGPAE